MIVVPLVGNHALEKHGQPKTGLRGLMHAALQASESPDFSVGRLASPVALTAQLTQLNSPIPLVGGSRQCARR